MQKRNRFFISAGIIILLYAAAFLFRVDPMLEMILIATLVVVYVAYFHGIVVGMLFGLVAGLFHFLWLLLSQNLAPETIPILATNILVPVLSGFLFGFFGNQTRDQQHKLIRSLEENKVKLAETTEKLEKYRLLEERITLEPAYRKEKSATVFSNPAIERSLGVCLEQYALDKNRKTSAEVLLAEQCFELVFRTVPGLLAIADLTGNVVTWNKHLMALLGYVREEDLKMPSILALIRKDQRDRAAQNLEQATKMNVNQKETYSWNAKMDMEIPDLGTMSLRFISSGNPYSILVVLQKSGKSGNLGYYVQNIYDSRLWVVSNEGKTIYVNHSMAEMLGYTPDNMSRYPVFHFLDEANTEIYHSMTGKAWESNEIQQKLEMVTISGKRVFASVTAFPMRNSGGIFSGMVLFVENITERSVVEKSLQHRLSIEKIITDISTRFIQADSGELTREIQYSMDHIGEFLGARESQITISASSRTGKGFQYRKIARNPDPGVGDKEETVAIPILSGEEIVGMFRFVQDASSRIWMEEDNSLLRMVGEIFIHALVRKEAEERLRISEEKMRITLHSIGDAVITTEVDGRIVMINQEAQNITGWRYEEAVGKPFEEVFCLMKGKILSLSDTVTEEADTQVSMAIFDWNTPLLRSKQGIERFIFASASPIKKKEEGESYGTVYVFRDITEKKRKEEEILYLTFHDKLTGLHSRAFFEVELQRLDTKRQYPLTLILGDCNGLKITNDIFGHQEGDNLLKKIATIFKSVTRKEDIVARWGGDEFAVIMPRTSEQTAGEIRMRILEACKAADNNPIQPSVALGTATKRDPYESIGAVLKEAEDRMYRHKLLESKSTKSSIIASLQKTLIEKSNETEEHAERMQEFSERIGRAIGLSENETDDLRLLSVLHDMGKIGIPDSILEKPSELSEEEWEVMKTHSEKGFSIAETSQEMSNIAVFIRHHHERWDGTGYPYGLSENEIPKLSRIISIVDAYDVITHNRPYKKALTHEEAIEEIKACAGTQFDPKLVEVFLDIMKDYRKEHYLDEGISSERDSVQEVT